MSFMRRYFLWLFVPPVFLILPVAFAFLTQVVQMSVGRMLVLAGLLGVLYAVGCVVLYASIAPILEEIEETSRRGGDLSTHLTAALRRTVASSFFGWIGGVLVFSAIGTWIAMPTPLGFSYFAVGSIIAAFFAIAWGYFAAKTLLGAYAARATTRARYNGAELSLAKKIAIVFIGTFIVSSAALVQLVSSKVSTTLETLAINSSVMYFDTIYGLAAAQSKIDQSIIGVVANSIPNDYLVHHIDKAGKVTGTGEALTAEEVANIRRMRNGDSSSYIGPHVSRFAELPDGSIIVLSIPWGAYASIPRQIAFYTALIALMTTFVFVVATWFLTRDITFPLKALSESSRQMAQGNFEAEEHVFADDEVGKLAESFASTRQNLRGLLARVGGSGTVITGGVRVITGGTESLLSSSRDQAELTEKSTRAVENVRSGIGRIVSAADGVSSLTQDASSRSFELQASAEQVARSMDHLFQSVEKTSSSTTEMNASASEMSTRAEVLAGIGDEVLSFVSEMDSTIADLRASSQKTADLSRQAREDAAAGGRAVERTVEGINESQRIAVSTAEALEDLNRSVAEVTQILSVIEEITNRTNLLALNAAIIAAQAGEQGSSFTVVADEIRQLADRTRKSTKEINAIIKAVQLGSKEAVEQMHAGVDRVKVNVSLAQEASASLEKIVASATSSFEMATKISRALDDQARATRHLHEVTSRMSDHIAEIAKATREQARGTELLAQEAELVRDIALQVKGATQEQSSAGLGITQALERIAEDAGAMRDLLQAQMQETDRIADASRVMLDIARKNDSVAREFSDAVQTLVKSGQDFESEVSKFRISH
jgi:methyl-accepting chemotaxis protein